jgi:hypothetical protein
MILFKFKVLGFLLFREGYLHAEDLSQAEIKLSEFFPKSTVVYLTEHPQSEGHR